VPTRTVDIDSLTVKALTPETWPAYAAMIERHGGIFGGCWCIWFAASGAERTGSYEGNRAVKEQQVRAGRGHAAIVFDGDEAVAWCQYGTPEELPYIYHRKQYLDTATRLPDYRLTCLFVDKRYRRRGLSAVALQGALDLIAAAGGGVAEGYPRETTPGKRESVLYNGSRALFERAGFAFDRPKGAFHTVMVKTVAPA
jgi:GNAT superfamily N-acetyltransferase